MAEKLYSDPQYTLNRDELQLVLEALEYTSAQLLSVSLSDTRNLPCLDRFIEEKRADIARLRDRLETR
jgi:hypothetical protein